VHTATTHPAGQPAAPCAPTPPGWADLVPQRSALVRYARQRLRDPAQAEDLVHDVFEAVVTGRARYEGRAALRTWLVGILKHKIVDLVRQRAAWAPLDGDQDGDEASGPADHLACPQPRPDEVAAQRERLAQTLARIRQLPDTLRPVVELRLLQDQDSQQVCRTLGLSPTNLFVRLHRARQMLAA
jgi:RNA polymerase sigma-70 factor, ECF subfamily